MKKTLILLVLTGALLAVPAASAHVTVNPNEAPAESFTRFFVRVPTERPNADTTKVVLRLPEGLGFVNFEPKPGWQRTVTMEKLAKPVTNDDGETTTERIATVTWEGGKIGPGEFDEFGMSAQMPATEGALVFPAVQTYSNGEIVRWIGAPDSDTPAPRVVVTPKVVEALPVTTTATASTESSDDGGRDGLTLGLAIAALVAGVAALAVTFMRRPKSA